MNKIDKVIKVSLVHSIESDAPLLKELIDVNLSIDDQLKLVRELALFSIRKGLSIKQKYLLKGTLEELKIKFEYLDEETKELYYRQNSSIDLKGVLDRLN